MHIINDVEIKGVSSAVPRNIVDNRKSLKNKNILNLIGVHKRHLSNDNNLKTSDLCIAAAKKLISQNKIDKKNLNFLIFVSQTRDFILPSSAFLIQDKLKLKKKIFAIDLPLGCSGYIYGLFLSFLISSNIKGDGLLLCGDMSSRFINKKNESTYSLFGDPGTASFIKYKKNSKSIFEIASDGSNFEDIILFNPNFYPQKNKSKYLNMNGASVFNFAINEVPEQINNLLIKSNQSLKDIDYFVFHQANDFIINHISKKIGIPQHKILKSIKNFGNTNSASIPLSMNVNQNLIKDRKLKVILSGFGVGLSWASVLLNIDKLMLTNITKL